MVYLLEAVSLLLLQPLWGVWSSVEPSWLESIGEQNGELLSFIAANLLVLSILTRRAVDSAFDTAKIATIAAIIVAYAAAISYFDPENVSAASLFLLNALPLFISAGYLHESFWWVVVPAVVSFFVGLAAGSVALVLFSLSINITTGVMLVCMPLSFFGSMYLLMRWRRSQSTINSLSKTETAETQSRSESRIPTPEETDVECNSLIGLSRDEYSSEYFAHVLEQYRLFVEMADRISQRRQRAHAFFLTLNMGLVVFLGLALPEKLVIIESLWYVILGAAGTALSIAWFQLIKSYGDLNTGKFQVIHQMEEHLPLKPYNVEWDEVGRGEDASLYKPFTRIEIYIPGMFALRYRILIAMQFLT